MRDLGCGHGTLDERLQHGSERYSNDSRKNKFENTAARAGTTYTGTITEVSAASITVETEADGEVSIPLSDSTTFIRDRMGGPGENGQTPPDDEDQGTVYVQGSGDVTVTVESYSTDVDTAGAAAAGSLLDYAVEKHKNKAAYCCFARCVKRGPPCDEVQ